jgi:hypothetical protein
MVNRETYVAKMKAQLEKWNAQVGTLDSSARRERGGAKIELKKQVGILRSRLDDAMFRLELVQGASADAWQDIKRGADEARKNMEQALEKARTHFKDI